MKSLTMVLLAAAFATAHAATPLPAGASRDGWSMYEVPMVDGDHHACCYESRGGQWQPGCDLRGDAMVVRDTPDALGTPGRLRVYVEAKNGALEHLRAFDAACPVRAGAPIARIEVAPADSVRWLEDVVASDPGEEPARNAIHALAQHAEPSATGVLIGFAGDDAFDEDVRQDAIFWLGQTRGREGADAVLRIARDGRAGIDLRRHAVFSLSQTSAYDPFDALVDIARHDDDAELRGHTLFWLAQEAGERAAPMIREAARDPDGELQEEAVFALSQLDEGADEALIEVVRGDYPERARRQALFWLGQSGSDEALRFLDDVLQADASR